MVTKVAPSGWIRMFMPSTDMTKLLFGLVLGVIIHPIFCNQVRRHYARI